MDFDSKTLDWDPNSQFRSDPEADKALAVRFTVVAVKNDAASREAGRLICEDTEMIEIRVRGDRNNIVIRPVREDDIARFGKAYMDWKAKKTNTVVGTPLKEWPALSVSMIEELNYLGFHTIEDLSNAGDNVVGKMAGLSLLRIKAKAFIDAAAGGSPLEKLADRLDALQAQQEVANRNAETQAVAYAELHQKYLALLEKSTATA